MLEEESTKTSFERSACDDLSDLRHAAANGDRGSPTFLCFSIAFLGQVGQGVLQIIFLQWQLWQDVASMAS